MKPTPTELHNIDPRMHADGFDRHTNQLWVGIWIITILVLAGTFTVRRLTGNSASPLGITLQIILNGLVIANFWLINTRYARIAQGIYVLAIHLTVPLVLLLYGGTRGFGDIALYMALLLGLLYGWQPWMFFTYSLMGAALVLVLYWDSSGHPISPMLNYSSQFTTFKFVITAFMLVSVLRYVSAFYKRLLKTYRRFAEEQVHLNAELKLSEQALELSNKNLLASRQTIVTVREEERRRLRRDLHDDLGPTLAAQVFQVGVAQQLVEQNPAKAVALLTTIESGIRDTLATVRELAYGLRPPMLDQLGLLGALSDIARQQEGRLRIRLDLPAELSPISAAAEVAMFRIFQTALDNVTTHAHATCCDVQLRASDQSVMLTVIDDGMGIGDRYIPGVGLTSIQERTSELGGTFYIMPVQPHGTLLHVTLPLQGITVEAR